MSITRWDYSKSKSSYHFDPKRDEDAEPPFRILGHVNEDLKSELERLLRIEAPEEQTFANALKKYRGGDAVPYTLEMDREELRYRGISEDDCLFCRLPIRQSELFLRVGASFGMESWRAGLHLQYPGQSFIYHVDELPDMKQNDPDHWLDRTPEAAARFAIQILDWEPGHVWAFGNTYWKQWRAGEIAFHDWRDVPHGTANLSRSLRATLQVTGLVTARTRRIIEDGLKAPAREARAAPAATSSA